MAFLVTCNNDMDNLAEKYGGMDGKSFVFKTLEIYLQFYTIDTTKSNILTQYIKKVFFTTN